MMSAAVECLVASELEAFSLGRLAEAETDAIAEHLAHCARCVAALQQLSASDTLIDACRAQTIVAQAAQGPVDAELLQQIIEAAKQLHASVDHASSAAEAPAYEIDNLQQLDEFRLVKVLGLGGMGVVFEAEDLQLQRRVAVKALLPKHAAKPHGRERFLREARAIAGLEHDNIVPVHYVGEDKGVPYFVMPLLAGESLETRRRRQGTLSLDEILLIGIAVADGLEASHRRGIVHRDVKPANVWLEEVGSQERAVGSQHSDESNGQKSAVRSQKDDNPLPAFRVKLLDFGLAHNDQQDIHLTQDGMLVGTPAYMAPEQASGLPADARSDLFSLGTLLYVMASGQPPFDGGGAIATLRVVAEQPAAPLGALNPGLPKALVAVIDKLHAKDPGQRFASAAEVARELRTISASLATAGPKTYAGGFLRRRQGLAAGLLFALSSLVVCEAAGVTSITRGFRGPANNAALPQLAAPAEQPIIAAAAPEAKAPRAYPLAVLAFEERGAKDAAAKVTDLLYAKLAGNDALFLVDRADLKKVLAEAELNLSGAVKSSEAIKVGQLTGAKLLVTGSVNAVDKKIVIVAKIIGVETSRVVAVSVEAKANDDLGAIVDQLAEKLGETILKRADDLTPKQVEAKDRLAATKQSLPKGERPTLFIQVAERHISLPKVDPAAQTELVLFSKETGFPVTDDEGPRSKADIIIKGEGICETAMRHGNLVSVRARLEVKAVERKTDKVLAVDRQTVVVVDLTEALAGKAALQEAAAQIAERMLPKLVRP
jgi:TolB-like protein